MSAISRAYNSVYTGRRSCAFFSAPHFIRPMLRVPHPPICHQHHLFHHLPIPHRKSSLPVPPLPFRAPHAVQTRLVSDDSDGEVHENPAPQKSYSVGVTVVSGFDARLRRNVIEKIVSTADVGRVVVITTGGITSTEDTDGQMKSQPQPSTADESDPSAKQATIPVPPSALNGLDSSPPIPEDPQRARAITNLEGWISCSSSEEMAEVVVKLAASREYDYIIAEGSLDNELEPHELAQLLQSRCGASLRIDTLVSVLDGDTLLCDLSAVPGHEHDEEDPSLDSSPQPEAVGSPESIQDAKDTQPMMLVSLVENANVIIVNQNSEPSQDDQLARVQNLISVLNGSASIISATDSSVPVEQLVNTNTYNQENVLLGATWKKALVASRSAERGTPRPALSKNLKDSAFVYRARRPFHPTRLYQHIKAVATFAGVIRSTGRIWLATRMLAPLEWNQAGVSATLRVGKLFWAAVPETEWPTEEEERERITQNWDARYGDRETEMVFVGMDIDKVRLQGLLDGCLLQDEEMVFNNLWENFEDPFVEWVPLIEEDEDTTLDGESSPEDEVLQEQLPTQDMAVEPESEAALEDASPIESSSYQEDLSEPPVAEERGKNEISDAQEGPVLPESLPEDVVEQISALDVFERGFDCESEVDIVPQPRDDGLFDEEDAVIASWEGAEADAILTQIPSTGLPVTIVTGFLGSGKTTLLNYILNADHGLQIAVLVNEFGEIDIDNQLVEKGEWSSKDEVLQLANGCICCSINDNFVGAVAKILESSKDINYLVVETTGVADPVPVINSLMVSDLADMVRVDGILTLVDAENFDPETQMGSEAALSQIMAADTILLSKTDIATSEKVEKTIEYIKSVRPAARILKSQRGRVPINMILDVGVRVADSPAHLTPVRRKAHVETDEQGEGHGVEFGSDEASENHGKHSHGDSDHHHGDGSDHHHGDGSDHECGPECNHESHAHSEHSKGHLEADGFVTTSLRSDRALDPELFMKKFLQQLPEGVFRAKGLLFFYGYEQRYVFQLSGRRYQFEEDEWPEEVAPGNQMVIIGRDLDLQQLRKTLESCLVDEE